MAERFLAGYSLGAVLSAPEQVALNDAERIMRKDSPTTGELDAAITGLSRDIDVNRNVGNLQALKAEYLQNLFARRMELTGAGAGAGVRETKEEEDAAAPPAPPAPTAPAAPAPVAPTAPTTTKPVDSISLLFGDDPRAGLFANAILSRDTPCDLGEKKDALLNAWARGIVYAEYYKDNVSGSGTNIHRDFSDFIIKIGQLFRNDEHKNRVRLEYARLKALDVRSQEEENALNMYKQYVNEDGSLQTSGDDLTKLGGCLPLVKEYGTLYYTKVGGGMSDINNSVSYKSKDILQKLLDGVFGNPLVSITGEGIGGDELLKPVDHVGRPAKFFNIDNTKILSLLEAEERYKVTASKESSKPLEGNLDHYKFLHSGNAVDSAYGLNWKWCEDKKQYYQMVNGEKKYYSELSKDDSCYGMALNGKCERFITCLTSGNSQNLSTCMDVLEDKDMYKVAEEDYKNVHPTVVKGALSRFGFKKYKDTGRVISYDKWLSTLSEGQVKTAINNNPKLQTYLKALVSIYNQNLVKGDGGDKLSEYATRLGKKKFRQTFGSNEERRKSIADKLRDSLYPTTMSNPNEMIDALSYGALGNGTYVSQPVGSISVPVMTGGSGLSGVSSQCTEESSLCTSKYDTMFNNIESGLRDVGLKLQSSDSENIKEFLNKVKKNEETLEELMKILKVMVELGRGYGITITDDSDVTTFKPLSELNSYEDIKANLGAHIKSMTQKIKEQNERSQKDISKLFNSYLPNMLMGNVSLGQSGRVGIVQEFKERENDAELVSISQPM